MVGPISLYLSPPLSGFSFFFPRLRTVYVSFSRQEACLFNIINQHTTVGVTHHLLQGSHASSPPRFYASSISRSLYVSLNLSRSLDLSISRSPDLSMSLSISLDLSMSPDLSLSLSIAPCCPAVFADHDQG